MLFARHDLFSFNDKSDALQGLAQGFLGFNAKEKTARLIDAGDEPFQASNLAFIGKAVASVLKHPSETANKYLQVASFSPTQNQIVAALEELTNAKWTTTSVSSADLTKTGEEKFAKGDFSAFLELLQAHCYAAGKGNGLTAETSANKVLGLEEEDLKDTLRKWLAGAGAI